MQIGLFFGVLFLFLIVGIIGRAAFGYRSYRGYGPGPGDWRYGPPRSDAAQPGESFDDWHRRAHGDPTASVPTGTGTPAPRS